MRLIDADYLLKIFNEIGHDSEKPREETILLDAVYDIIIDAPTIEINKSPCANCQEFVCDDCYYASSKEWS